MSGRSRKAGGTAAAPEGDPAFARRIIAWQRRHGRHDLPWQNTRDPYRIWLSEIMLQQTQVGTVLGYYERFLARFPDVASLAAADLDAVLQLWSGLGYYSRARNLHRAAQAVMARHGGHFPQTREELETLPGVGRSTAAAIAAFAFGRREAILDGNVKRVLARHFAVAGFPGEKPVTDRLWKIAESLLPAGDGKGSEAGGGPDGDPSRDQDSGSGIEAYTQGLMDLGATLCTRTPDCGRCPVRASCQALARAAVADFPAARMRRAVPRRETWMPILLQAGRVWLEARPASGIWGGLWSFPELESASALADWSVRRLGLQPGRIRALPVLRHGFTHFSLDIHPLLCDLADSPAAAVALQAEPPGRWLALAEALQAAVPTPVRTLLAQVGTLHGEFALDNNESAKPMAARRSNRN